ncbi:MAG TPA: alpha/beta hydrolase [Candidatus Dormibacteraeota bacterium]|nr:alpha/beta hydrolase [Candidatus Dormibacteraeota bacterium]
MARIRVKDLDVEYEEMGVPAAAPMLLIMGLGAQLKTWDDGFVEALAARGFRVIRYDNRDSGLSTKMEAAGPPDVMGAIAGDAKPAYTLDDMADDAVGVLDALGIRAAHVVGASMGGFIAQLVAINHPDRVLSLTSIMSGPGGEDTVPPTPEAGAVLVITPGATREEQLEQGVMIRRVHVGDGNPFDEAAERLKAERLHDRSYYPVGTGRQLVAILAAKSRLPALAGVRVPTLVVHGLDDPLIPIENGRRVAAAVPGARMIELDGTGHDLPRRHWQRVADAIAETARQASPISA